MKIRSFTSADASGLYGCGLERLCADYAAQVLSVERWPELNEPLMIVALAGWVDAGGAGAGSMSVLSEQLVDGHEFGAIDLSGLSDLQQTRPVARWEGDARVMLDFCDRAFGGFELGANFFEEKLGFFEAAGFFADPENVAPDVAEVERIEREHLGRVRKTRECGGKIVG